MRVKLSELFEIWFQRTNPHLFKKKTKKSVITKEVEEYVNDVLFEHIESMEQTFSSGENNETGK